MTSGDDAITARARAVLRDNDRGGYTVPSPRLYPFQWNWDSCLVAPALARMDAPRGWAEIENLFIGQWDSGMVPHIVFHRPDPTYRPGPEVWGVARDPPTSGLTQPPVAATTVRRMLERARDADAAEDAARRLLPKLAAWRRWFRQARDPDGEGLVSILHPWEAGRDNAVEWDAALARVAVDELAAYGRHDIDLVDPAQRPPAFDYDRYMALAQAFRRLGYDDAEMFRRSRFNVVDLGVNFILLRADRDLLWLARRFRQDRVATEIETGIARAESGLDTLWNPDAGRFHAFDRVAGRPITAPSSATFLAFYAGVASGARGQRLATILRRWARDARFMVPSHDPNDDNFEPLRYWRGPVWMICNFMFADGLAAAGHDDLAARIVEDSRALIRHSGLREYFAPGDGRGLGGECFSWTAAMWLDWLDPALDRAPSARSPLRPPHTA